MGIRGGMLAQAKYKSSEVEAVIIKADGTRIPLGVVAYHHRNPILNLIGALRTLRTNWKNRKLRHGQVSLPG